MQAPALNARNRLPLDGLARRAVFALVVAYAALLATCYARGIWYVGPEGRPIAVDFIAFWAAGKLVLAQDAAAAYDWVLHKAVAVDGIGADFSGYFSFQYPPTFLALTVGFAPFPYLAALFAWMTAGLAAYALAIRYIGGTWGAVLAALAWPAVLYNASVGQNGFVTAALLGGGVALLRSQPLAAGILLGLLTFKPQFGLLIPIALLAGGHWRAIATACATALAMAALSTALLGPDIWSAFASSAASINTAILGEGSPGFAKLQSVYGAMRAQGFGPAVAWTAHASVVAGLGVAVLAAWRSAIGFEARAALLSSATLMASPYVFTYDLVALAVPLAFLGRTGFSRGELAMLVVAGSFMAWGPSEYLATGLASALIVLGLAANRCVGERREAMGAMPVASARWSG